ncbi:MAG TPA: serpin family protein [Bdellovibrio sp.]|nr:serpin family protein [Bdellovibrio sp.]
MNRFFLGFMMAIVPVLTFAQTNKISEANNQFAFDLYKLNAKESGNLIFSPISIEAALAMTAAGAQEETLKQMLATLHLKPGYHNEFKTLLADLKGGKDFQLQLANRIWGKMGSAYNPTFLKVLLDNYGADLTPLDFQKQPEPSRLKINQWVSEKTQQKIKDLLPPGSIDPEITDLVLTNAIYFKGNWINPFEKELTTNGDFHISTSSKKKTPFMHLTEHFKYAENPEMQYVSLPYKGDELEMDIFLPTPKASLAKIERTWGVQKFFDLIKSASTEEVVVSLPKFKTESRFDLNKDLTKLGMPLAFDTKRANFQGMRKLSSGENLYISSVVHKAFVDVNETGTEAAAATAVMMAVSAAMAEPPKIFNADHPFLFFIRHTKSNAILFMGRFSEP